MIGSFFEAIFTVVGTVIGWLFRPLIREIRTALGLDRPKTAPAGIKQRELHQDVKNGILAALQADKEAKAALPPGWRGSYSAISSDSEKIGDLAVGTEIRLVLEPDDPDREDAVRAEADLPDRSTVRIGHLRRGHELSRSIAYGRVRCWFAARRRTLRADAWETVLFVAVYDP
ncbi:hypothetical protein [Reyranella sp.]|jgi:hypothetical protein|uniref:hypothetical protein n=1 Tax=Reyranella sp. TaxID=1929291 RepID=UPI00271CB0B1|nr:hypothetical protein [Reyranella sp.]MDO8974870.1 hypothetical protein [Reyranella sp.]